MRLFAPVFLLRLLNVLEMIGTILMNLRSYRSYFVEVLMLILVQTVNYFSLFKNLLLILILFIDTLTSSSINCNFVFVREPPR